MVWPRAQPHPERPGMPELRAMTTGDPGFDAEYFVETDDPGFAQRVLGPDVRAAIYAMAPRRIALAIQGGAPALSYDPWGHDGIEPALAVLALIYEHAARG